MCNARKQGGKQLLSPMVSMVLMFLGPLNMGEHSPVLSVPISTFRWVLRDLPGDCWPHISHPFSIWESSCHWLLSHHGGGEGGVTRHRLSPRCHHSTSTIQSTSLHLHDKPCNAPQWAILGEEVGKSGVHASYSFVSLINDSFLYFMGLCFI